MCAPRASASTSSGWAYSRSIRSRTPAQPREVAQALPCGGTAGHLAGSCHIRGSAGPIRRAATAATRRATGSGCGTAPVLSVDDRLPYMVSSALPWVRRAGVLPVLLPICSRKL